MEEKNAHLVFGNIFRRYILDASVTDLGPFIGHINNMSFHISNTGLPNMRLRKEIPEGIIVVNRYGDRESVYVKGVGMGDDYYAIVKVWANAYSVYGTQRDAEYGVFMYHYPTFVWDIKNDIPVRIGTAGTIFDYYGSSGTGNEDFRKWKTSLKRMGDTTGTAGSALWGTASTTGKDQFALQSLRGIWGWGGDIPHLFDAANYLDNSQFPNTYVYTGTNLAAWCTGGSYGTGGTVLYDTGLYSSSGTQGVIGTWVEHGEFNIQAIFMSNYEKGVESFYMPPLNGTFGTSINLGLRAEFNQEYADYLINNINGTDWNNNGSSSYFIKWYSPLGTMGSFAGTHSQWGSYGTAFIPHGFIGFSKDYSIQNFDYTGNGNPGIWGTMWDKVYKIKGRKWINRAMSGTPINPNPKEALPGKYNEKCIVHACVLAYTPIEQIWDHSTNNDPSSWDMIYNTPTSFIRGTRQILCHAQAIYCGNGSSGNYDFISKKRSTNFENAIIAAMEYQIKSDCGTWSTNSYWDADDIDSVILDTNIDIELIISGAKGTASSTI